jgi:septal ring factor EnvC (AmiA/AmiB activator)
MHNRPLMLDYAALLVAAMLVPGVAVPAMAQDRTVQNNTAQESGAQQQPSAREQLQHIHGPRSIDQELARLTKDLELTADQQKQVRPLLEQHHDKIQALLDKNPKASRQELGPQIHAISDETHHEIHALLTDHQKELEKAMLQREHRGEERRRPTPPPAASPADNAPDPSLSLS